MKSLTKYMPLMAVITAMLCMSARAGIITNLDVRPVIFSPSEGLPVDNVTVATFTDPGEPVPGSIGDGGNDVTNYTASITWGDGTATEAATLVANGSRGFDVLGTHTYTNEGIYLLVVEVSDLDGSSGSTNLLVTVTDAPLSASGLTVTPAEAVEFYGVVATFTDANPYGTMCDFSATIDWGDGTVTPGAITANQPGGFVVLGTHTYPHQGSFAIAVSIADVGGSTASAATTASVSDAPLLAAGVNINPMEGIPFSGVVATFTHADTNALPTEFTALISPGDGAPSEPGLVTANGPGNFEVSFTHAYLNEGSFAVLISIVSSGGSVADAGATATVGDALLTATGVTVAGTEGFPIAGVVATFTDANTNTTPDGYYATIDWGDGGTSSGLISTNDTGGFSVTGSHTYVEEGTFAIAVVINDVGGAGASVGTTANVSDAPLSASGTIISPVEGAPFTSAVATISDANPYSTSADFTAVINWGDGSSSPGVITAVENKDVIIVGSLFNVMGSHTYKQRGSYGITVAVYDQGGGASAGSTADVADAPLTSIGRLITPTENASFLAVVASFTDANPYGTTNEFTASLDWGDGTTSSGTIIANNAVNTGAAEFVVLGSHRYANQGLYPLAVTIQSAGGSRTSANTLAATADAPMIGTGTTITAVKGVAFTNVLANCIDTDTSPEPESTYNCIINWGDGSTSTGTMSEGDEESYAVTGSHTYMLAGSYVVLVTIDNTQTFVSTTARSTVLVSEQPADNVSSLFVIKATRPHLDKRTGLFRQVVTIRNTSRQAVSGPVSLVLDNLSNGGGSIDLFNKDAETVTPAAAPLGSPYKNVLLPKGNMFKGRTTRTLILFFSSSSPAITYNARVLAGPGAR